MKESAYFRAGLFPFIVNIAIIAAPIIILVARFSTRYRHRKIIGQFHTVKVSDAAVSVLNFAVICTKNRIVSALRQLEPDSVERLKTHIAVKGNIAVDPTTAALISRPTGKEIAALRKQIIPQVEWVFLGIGNCHQIFAFQRTAVALERDGVLRLLALVRAGAGFLRRLRWDQREQQPPGSCSG